MDFKSFNFHPMINVGIKTAGYETPTPIQAQAIGPTLEGRDVMGLAQTGTGKTAAFVLPILQRLMRGPRRWARALIIAPTRELAEQINDDIITLGAKTRLKSVPVYGGVNIAPQIKELRAGAEIVVACPGRLLDHIERGTINLSQVEVLVLDEADRMLDMGFMPDIKKILRYVLMRKQTLMFSATMPQDIKQLANEILFNPLTLQVEHSAPAKTVSHSLYPVAEHLKTALMKSLLTKMDTGSILVFTRTKIGTDRLAKALEGMRMSVTSIQGDLSQYQRQAALDGFKDGTFRILVATDIAARGIDVSGISHVINYDMPGSVDDYTHRIGRTGRAEQTGDAITFFTPEDENMVRSIERVLGEKLERLRLEGFDYSRPAPAGRGGRGGRGSSAGRDRRGAKDGGKGYGGPRGGGAKPKGGGAKGGGARRSKSTGRKSG